MQTLPRSIQNVFVLHNEETRTTPKELLLIHYDEMMPWMVYSTHTAHKINDRYQGLANFIINKCGTLPLLLYAKPNFWAIGSA